MADGWNAAWVHVEGSFKPTYNQASASRIREDIIVKYFKKCGISNGSEDHEDTDDSEEEEGEESSDDGNCIFLQLQTSCHLIINKQQQLPETFFVGAMKMVKARLHHILREIPALKEISYFSENL